LHTLHVCAIRFREEIGQRILSIILRRKAQRELGCSLDLSAFPRASWSVSRPINSALSALHGLVLLQHVAFTRFLDLGREASGREGRLLPRFLCSWLHDEAARMCRRFMRFCDQGAGRICRASLVPSCQTKRPRKSPP
jgi:hypothetical protein